MESTELSLNMITKTFVDKGKEYLVKVFKYTDITKVFIFSIKNEVVKNFEVIINQHKLKFHLEDNSEPLKIDMPIEAKKIELRFQ